MCSDGIDVNFCETERRQTYKPQTSIVNEESIVSTVHSSLQQLVPVSSRASFSVSLDGLFESEAKQMIVLIQSLQLPFSFHPFLSLLSSLR